jgi:hypothetical protein
MRRPPTLKLVMTCEACPEQYDVFHEDGSMCGYLRLRHGHFRVEFPDCGGEQLYSANTKGDGSFDDDEREYHLRAAMNAIYRRLEQVEDDGG